MAILNSLTSLFAGPTGGKGRSHEVLDDQNAEQRDLDGDKKQGGRSSAAVTSSTIDRKKDMSRSTPDASEGGLRAMQAGQREKYPDWRPGYSNPAMMSSRAKPKQGVRPMNTLGNSTKHAPLHAPRSRSTAAQDLQRSYANGRSAPRSIYAMRDVVPSSASPENSLEDYFEKKLDSEQGSKRRKTGHPSPERDGAAEYIEIDSQDGVEAKDVLERPPRSTPDDSCVSSRGDGNQSVTKAHFPENEYDRVQSTWDTKNLKRYRRRMQGRRSSRTSSRSSLVVESPNEQGNPREMPYVTGGSSVNGQEQQVKPSPNRGAQGVNRHTADAADSKAKIQTREPRRFGEQDKNVTFRSPRSKFVRSRDDDSIEHSQRRHIPQPHDDSDDPLSPTKLDRTTTQDGNYAQVNRFFLPFASPRMSHKGGRLDQLEPIRTNSPPGKFAAEVSPIDEGFDSTDELAVEHVASIHFPPKKRDRERDAVPARQQHASDASMQSLERPNPLPGAKPEFIPTAKATKLLDTAAAKQTQKRGFRQPKPISIKAIYCRCCQVEGNGLCLSWDSEQGAFFVEFGGKPVRGSDGRVAHFRKNDARNWQECTEVEHTWVLIKGPSSWRSNGKILIRFMSFGDRDRCYDLLSSAPFPKLQNESEFTMSQIGTNILDEIIQDAERNKLRTNFDSQFEAQRNRKEVERGIQSEEEIQYEEIEMEPSTPPTRARQRMQPSQLELERQSISEKPTYRGTMRSTLPQLERLPPLRSTRAQMRERSPPAAPRRSASPKISWTQLHKPKRWSQSVVYPPSGKERVTVDFEDLERLNEDEFLNDNVVAFAIRRIREAMEPQHREKVHFFNSFFFSGLTQKDGKQRFNYDAVKRWTKSKDLFAHPYVVVPINANLHWFVAIICNLPNLPRKLSGVADGDDEVMEDTAPAPPLERGMETGEVAEDAEGPKNERVENNNFQDLTSEDVKSNFSDSGRGTARGGADVPIEIEDSQADGNIIIEIEDSQNGTAASGTANLAESSPIAAVPAAAITDANRLQNEMGKKGKKKPPQRRFDPDIPAIITLDSFGLSRNPEIRYLKEYLKAEAQEKRGMDVDTKELQGMTAKGIPEQSNFSDCGVYLVGYIEEFAKDPEKFVTKVMTRSMEVTDFEGFNAAEKRAELRDELLRLNEKQEEERLRKVERKAAKSTRQAMSTMD